MTPSRARTEVARGAVIAAAAAALIGLGSLAWAQEPPTPPAPPPPPDPKAILEGACTMCHGLDFITERRKSHDDWQATVSRMMDKGASLGPDEAAALVDYLAKTYPAADAAAGPKGPGR